MRGFQFNIVISQALFIPKHKKKKNYRIIQM